MTGEKSSSGLISGGVPTVYVSDLDRAVRFYTETLGLKLQMRAGDEYASVDAGRGLVFGLHPAEAGRPKPGTHGSIELGFGPTGRIEEVVAELRAKGVAFDGPIVNDPPVKLAYFHDPDGNVLYLCEYGGGEWK